MRYDENVAAPAVDGNLSDNSAGPASRDSKQAREQVTAMTSDRITRNTAAMGGKPCIRNLRVTVGMITGLVAAGKPWDAILKLYPYLEVEDIKAALAYAAWRAEEQEVELPYG